MSVTDEQIAAFADGQLDGAERALVEQAVAADPALARKVESHRALKAMLGAHFAPILDQPVPDRLNQLLQTENREANVISLAAHRQKRGLAPAVRRWLPATGTALAASLVLAIMQPWGAPSAPGDYASGGLAAALNDQLVATQSAGAETRILLSFSNDAGQICRAYRAGNVGGIACRDDKGWDIEREFALDAAQVTAFRQAGSEADLLAAAQNMASGNALDAAAEAQARQRGWR